MVRRGQRFVECAAVAALALLAPLALWRLGAAIDSPATLGLVALCAIAAWLCIDFMSGVVHWAGDTWGSARTPFLGRAFIFPFREHHEDPQAMTRHDFVEINGACCVAAAPVLAFAAFAPVHDLAARAFLVFLALSGMLANQCHKWAHTAAARRGPLVRALQHLRFLLPPEHHRQHHGGGFDSHYCTVNGWMNAPLNAIGFFRALEAIGKACGARPRAPDAQSLGYNPAPRSGV